LTTPDRGVLDGMTRRTVIELAEDMQIKATQAPVSAAALYGANEVFLTTTAGGIIPVTSIDGRPVGAGLIGGVTASLHEAYWARRSEGWHAEPVNYTTAQPSVS
jgi:branched-chain amino acid aminotransferase